MSDGTPTLEEVIESDDPALAEAYNEAKRDEIAAELEHLDEQEQAAVDALRESAQQSLETDTVTLPSGVDLEVRARMPPVVENLQEKMQRARQQQDLQRARRLNCAMLAEMVESPGEYVNPDVWETASRDGNAGLQWLAEVTDIVVGPATENAEALQGNRNSATASDTTPQPTKDKQSGWQRQR